MDITPIIFDIETAGLPNAESFLEPVQAAKNLVDPIKIAKDIEDRTADRLAKIALDWNTGRIIALAWWTEERGSICHPCPNEAVEAVALMDFWQASRGRALIGFACKQFDLKYMIQRSRLLGLAHPTLDVGRYSKQGIIDLYLELTFNDSQDTYCMRRTLQNFCRRFGVPVEDTVIGADIPALIAANEWDAITSHCLSDVELTLALARKLRFVRDESIARIA